MRVEAEAAWNTLQHRHPSTHGSCFEHKSPENLVRHCLGEAGTAGVIVPHQWMHPSSSQVPDIILYPSAGKGYSFIILHDTTEESAEGSGENRDHDSLLTSNATECREDEIRT